MAEHWGLQGQRTDFVFAVLYFVYGRLYTYINYSSRWVF